MKRKVRLKPQRKLPINRNRRILHIWHRKRLIKERREMAFVILNES